MDEIKKLSIRENVRLEGRELAELMDKKDPLKDVRGRFEYPKMCTLPYKEGNDENGCSDGEESIYLAGNSLGLMPSNARDALSQVLDQWGDLGVYGHDHGAQPWQLSDEKLVGRMAKVVGATEHEVAIMNQLTVNLQLMMLSFYRPTLTRYKILHEYMQFSSDRYAMESHVRMHGLEPKDVLLEVAPRPGENNLRLEDIVKVLSEQGESIALVCMSGVHYYTGELMDIEDITKEGQKVGAFVGWDLAHAVGNVELQLHDWGVDWAVWCTYKYLNSGPGSAGGAFLHTKHFENKLPYLTGWWGHKNSTRMKMEEAMSPGYGIRRYRISNPSAFHSALLDVSLSTFESVGMPAIRAKSILLTGYLEYLLSTINDKDGIRVFEVITPKDQQKRGAQISIKFLNNFNVAKAFSSLHKKGLVCDLRRPDVIRLSPCPLYNSFLDVFKACRVLGAIIAQDEF